ncbi:MAG: hypothetical protein ACYDDF_01295 [Thermoplasmatota archaeon]
MPEDFLGCRIREDTTMRVMVAVLLMLAGTIGIAGSAHATCTSGTGPLQGASYVLCTPSSGSTSESGSTTHACTGGSYSSESQDGSSGTNVLQASYTQAPVGTVGVSSQQVSSYDQYQQFFGCYGSSDNQGGMDHRNETSTTATLPVASASLDQGNHSSTYAWNDMTSPPAVSPGDSYGGSASSSQWTTVSGSAGGVDQFSASQVQESHNGTYTDRYAGCTSGGQGTSKDTYATDSASAPVAGQVAGVAVGQSQSQSSNFKSGTCQGSSSAADKTTYANVYTPAGVVGTYQDTTGPGVCTQYVEALGATTPVGGCVAEAPNAPQAPMAPWLP